MRAHAASFFVLLTALIVSAVSVRSDASDSRTATPHAPIHEDITFGLSCKPEQVSAQSPYEVVVTVWGTGPVALSATNGSRWRDQIGFHVSEWSQQVLFGSLSLDETKELRIDRPIGWDMLGEEGENAGRPLFLAFDIMLRVGDQFESVVGQCHLDQEIG